MAGKYDNLTKAQLIQLLERHDRQKPLGLVWERDAIEADQAVSADFVACDLIDELCEKPAPWRNLVIEGDNFDALRWLRMAYSSRVKCIYIDPPYNTGNKDWVYNDHYFDTNDRYRHSTWLEFLYRRLTLARDLLTEDGVILVSINDENRARLELLMDEALPGMRLGSLVWRTRVGSNADQGCFLSKDHEHVLVFGMPGFKFSGTAKSFSIYTNEDGDRRGDWTRDNPTLGFNRYERPNLYYPVLDPKTEVWYPCNPNAVWRFASRTRMRKGQRLQSKPMEEMIEDGRILFPETQDVMVWSCIADLKKAIGEDSVPKRGNVQLIGVNDDNLEFWIGKKVGFGAIRVKRFKSELRNSTQPLSSWILSKSDSSESAACANAIEAGSNDEAAKSIISIFNGKAFNYPKPPSLIRELIRQASSHGDLVLDFFAGSATTAQAVMELSAEDDGQRRFIMVSSAEATEDEPDKNLCRDMTAKRIRLLNASVDKKFVELSTEFAYLRTRKVNFEDLDYDLKPREAWAVLEAMHDLPLTRYELEKPWQAHETDALTLVYVDRVDKALVGYLATLGERRANAFVYAWAPGQIKAALHGVALDIQDVRQTLVKRFQQ